jgi:hypothetical protein
MSVVPVTSAPSPKVTVTDLPASGGMPGPPDLSVTMKAASSVATGLMGVIVRLVVLASNPTVRVDVAEDPE